MRFHFPLEKRWDPYAVCDALGTVGLNAHVEGDVAVIDLPRVSNSRFRIIQAFERIRRYDNRITIRVLPGRMIERVDIESRSAEWWIEREDQISAALRSLGFLLVGDDISERKIVMRYCYPSLRLLHRLRALEEFDEAVWRSDVDLPPNCIIHRMGLVDKIEDMVSDTRTDFMETWHEDEVHLRST